MMTYNVTIYCITPLIIHTGEFYSVFEVLNTRDTNSVFLIDMERVFSVINENERERLFGIMDSLTAHVDNDKTKLSRVRSQLQSIVLQNSELIEQRVRTNPQFINGIQNNPYALIYKIFKDEMSGNPYIPGSTLKGALRTSILEALRKKYNIPDPQNMPSRSNEKNKFDTKDFEMQIMKNTTDAKFNIEKDPFRYFKVSDLLFNKKDVVFDTIRVIGKGSRERGIPIYTEMTASYYTEKIEMIAEGTITIDKGGLEKFYENNKSLNFIGDIEFIKKSIKDFSDRLLNNAKHPLKKDIRDSIDEICNAKGLLPLRLGRFTQIESKTFKIKRTDIKNNDMNINGGVSRSLIDGKIPAGWCGIKIQQK